MVQTWRKPFSPRGLTLVGAKAQPCLPWGEFVWNDRDSPHRAAAPLHVRRARAAASDHRPARGLAHAGRHLPGNPHPGHRGRSGSTPACRRTRWPAAWSRSSSARSPPPSTTSSISRRNSYTGVGIVKVFFQPGVDIRTANAQVTAISQTLLKQMPPGTTPPLILNYNASTVPIIQLALSGKGLSEQTLFDLGLNVVRTPLVTVPGAAIPYPVRRQDAPGPDRPRPGGDAGARPVRPGRRQRARRAEPDHAGRHAEDRQLRIRDPAQQRALGDRRRSATCRSRPSTAPWSTCATSAQVRDGNPPQTNIVHVDGNRSVLMSVLKNGAVSTLAIIDGIKDKVRARCKATAARQPQDLR